MKRAVFIIAQKGFRDEELKIPLKILQDNDIDCTIASITTDTAKGSQGMEIDPDITIEDINPNNYDVLIFIGGPGAPELAKHKNVIELIRSAKEKQINLAAICIAPTILAKAGILEGKRSTVWKSDESVKTLQDGGAIFVDEPVVVENKLITGNGPSAAREFAEKIIEMLKD